MLSKKALVAVHSFQFVILDVDLDELVLSVGDGQQLQISGRAGDTAPLRARYTGIYFRIPRCV